MGLYGRHFSDPKRERAFLSAVGFTTAFATARGITHAIKAGVGPFHNISEGGRHIHHSTLGIFGGLLTAGAAGRGALKELGLLPKALERFVD